MTDRDTFAAAALTGLMRFRGDSGQPGATWKSTAVIAAEAYKLADAMLRQTRYRTKEKRAEVSFTPTDAEREAVLAILGDPDLVLGDRRKPLEGLLERLG